MTIRSSPRVRFRIGSVGPALAAVFVPEPATVRRARGIRWFPLPQIMTIDPATIQHMHDLIASFPATTATPTTLARPSRSVHASWKAATAKHQPLRRPSPPSATRCMCRHHVVARDDRARGRPLMIWTDK